MSDKCWLIGSGCLKNLTRNTHNILLLKKLQCGGVSFGHGKKGYILGDGRFGKSIEDSIENVYHVSGLE